MPRQDDCSIARFNLPAIAASGLQKRDWLVVDGNIKNWLPVLTVAIGDDAAMPRAAPVGKPYLVAFFSHFRLLFVGANCARRWPGPPGRAHDLAIALVHGNQPLSGPATGAAPTTAKLSVIVAW